MVQDIVFAIMMVIAVGAGIITAVHEIGDNRKGNMPGNPETAENSEKEGSN
ncbi:MAG: hypothetical protein ACI4AB_13035 [Acetatifactor sp.]